MLPRVILHGGCSAAGGRASLKRVSGGPIFTQLPRCTSTGLTSSQYCSMGARRGPSPKPWLSALMPSTPGVCEKSFGSRAPGTLQMSLFGTLQAACQSERVKSFRLRFFGHLAWSNPEEDHHRVIAAALRPPSDWRRPAGRPRTTWLRTIGEDLQSLNFGVHTAWRKAKERDTWHQVVSTATLC